MVDELFQSNRSCLSIRVGKCTSPFKYTQHKYEAIVFLLMLSHSTSRVTFLTYLRPNQNTT